MDFRISRLASAITVTIGLIFGAPALADIISDDPVPTAPISRHLVEQDGIDTSVKRYTKWLAGRPERKEAKRIAALAPTRSVGGPTGDDFWRRLSNCESPTGVVGRYVGYFQFSWDTAAKVGIDGSESYEIQKAAAQRWASMVSPGTTAGWPVCWWQAQ